MTSIQFPVCLIGILVGYALSFWMRLGWWSPVIAFVFGVFFIVIYVALKTYLFDRTKR